MRKSKAYLERESKYHAQKRSFLGQKQEHLEAELLTLQKEVLPSVMATHLVDACLFHMAVGMALCTQMRALACRTSAHLSFCHGR